MTTGTTTITELPSGSSALPTDLVPIDRGMVTDHLTLAQISALISTNIIQFYTGNPNGNVAGTAYNLCWDSTDLILWICTLSGTSLTAVWTQASNGVPTLITPAFGGTGVSNPTEHTLPVAEGSSNFNFLGPLTNGQLLIGSTGVNPVPANITAGSNISIGNSAGSITISTTGMASVGWNSVSATTQMMSVNSGYVPLNSSLTTFTLPSTAAFGTTMYIAGYGSGGWTIAFNTGQQVIVGDLSSTIASGSVSSTNRYDSIGLLCVVANTTFTTFVGPQGNLTIV